MASDARMSVSFILTFRARSVSRSCAREIVARGEINHNFSQIKSTLITPFPLTRNEFPVVPSGVVELHFRSLTTLQPLPDPNFGRILNEVCKNDTPLYTEASIVRSVMAPAGAAQPLSAIRDGACRRSCGKAKA